MGKSSSFVPDDIQDERLKKKLKKMSETEKAKVLDKIVGKIEQIKNLIDKSEKIILEEK